MSAASDGTPAFLRRSEGEEDALVVVFPGPLAAGTQVTVDVTEVFVAIAAGRALAALGPGRHALPRAVDAGALVATARRTMRLGRTLPEIGGQALRAMGTFELTVVDPAALIGALRDLRAAEREALDHAIVTSAGELVERAVRAAVERGVTGDELGAALPALLREANALWPFPGMRVDLSAIEVSVGLEGEDDSDEDDSDGDEEEEDGEESEDSEGDLTDLIGEEVTVLQRGGRRVRGTVEAIGYLVRYANGESAWVPIDSVEVE